MAQFTTSAAGYDLIKFFEGLAKQIKDPQGNFTGFVKAYKPSPDDNWTIGYGQEGSLFPGTAGEIPVVEGLIITEKQAEEALKFFVLNVAEPLVNTHFNPETQGEFDALVSWVYNIRHDKLQKGGYSLPEVFNRKPREFDAIIEWWLKYVNPKTMVEQGLYRRRLAELCLMFGWPWKYATTAVLRRVNGAIVERTEPDYIFQLAETAAEKERQETAALNRAQEEKLKKAAPKAPKPKPEPAPKPISPKTVQPSEVPYKIDPNAGLKPLEESERAIGYFWQNMARLMLRLTGMGTFGTAAAGVANVVQSDAVLGSALLDLTIPVLVLASGVIIAFIVRQYGDWRRQRGERSARQALF